MKSGPVTGCERLEKCKLRENAPGAYKERRELRLSPPQRPQAARVAVLFQHTHCIAVAAAAAAARSPTMATQMSKKRKVCYLSTTGLRCKFVHKKENLPWLFGLLILCFCWFTGVVLDLCAVRSGRSFLRRIEWAPHQGARRGWLLRRGSACDSHAYRDYHPRHTYPECARWVHAALLSSCRDLGFRFGSWARLRLRGRVFCQEHGLWLRGLLGLLSGEKGRRIRELTSVVQKRFNFPEGTVELYAEKVNNRGLCAIAQAESLRYKLLGGLAVRRYNPRLKCRKESSNSIRVIAVS